MAENHNVDQSLRRFQPKPCRACHALSKKPCFFCGQSWTLRKMDMSDMEIIAFDAYREQLEYLRSTYNKLITFKMKTTGCESLDAQVRLYFGEWRGVKQ